jgi:hypothetical protein
MYIYGLGLKFAYKHSTPTMTFCFELGQNLNCFTLLLHPLQIPKKYFLKYNFFPDKNLFKGTVQRDGSGRN